MAPPRSVVPRNGSRTRKINIDRAAGAYRLILTVAFNLFFFLLARRLDYPDILRSPTEDILSRFQEGEVRRR